MVQFFKENFYFGDFKPENFLLTFHGKKIKIGDFGCSFFMQVQENFLKGLSFNYALP